MKSIKIPAGTPPGGELKVLIKIGTQGFSRTEVWKNGEWEPGQTIYVDQDTFSVVFSKIGNEIWKEILRVGR